MEFQGTFLKSAFKVGDIFPVDLHQSIGQKERCKSIVQKVGENFLAIEQQLIKFVINC